MTQRFIMNTPYGMKSISLENMTPDAFRTISGPGFTGHGSGSIVEYYRTVPWLHRAVDVIVGAMEALPKALMSGEDEVETTDVGIITDMTELFAKWTLWYILFGATYAVWNDNTARTRRNIQPWHPNYVEPVFTTKDGLTGFIRHIGTQSKSYPVEEVLYAWEYSAEEEQGPGKSRAQAALAAAGLLSSVDNFSTGFFANGAMGATLISIPLGTPKADKERLQSWVERTLTGLKNAFKPQVIEGGDAVGGMANDVKSIPLSVPPKDLVMPELTQAKREDIATALGVPQSILFSNAASGTASQQDKLNLYDETVIPLFYRFARQFNERVFKPMGLELVEQHGKMEIYQRQETSKAYGLAQLWTTNAVPREYVHDMLDLAEMYRKGTFYSDVLNKPNSANAGTGVPTLKKPPDLPDVPTVDAPEADDMMKADLSRWQRVALKRYKEGKPDKALVFDSDSIPAALAGVIRGKLKAVSTSDGVAGVFEQALVWGVYP